MTVPPEPMQLRYLSREDVARACTHVDVVDVVREALTLHASGQTTLPSEAYLGWQTAEGASARSLALPGALWGACPAAGVKIINASLGNVDRGIPRANGLTLMFDLETARPRAILEATQLSMLRTAAYTMLSLRLLAGQPVQRISIIGCGPVGIAHVRLLAAELPDAGFVLYDRDDERAEAAVGAFVAEGVRCERARTCEEAVRDAGVVVTATTTTTGYLPFDWIAPGAIVAHVSLDDLLADVVRRADLVLVDDWQLVSTDERRLLGRLCRSGDLVGPDQPATGPVTAGARAVDATLADVIVGAHRGRRDPDDIVLSNPFGMGILDVAVAAQVVREAERLELGIDLPA